MATVGLSFGSATSGAGFDVAATVTSILAVASAQETPWKAQLASLQAQDTALSGLGTNLSGLSTAVGSLTDFSGVFASKQGSSSNTNVVALTSASPASVAGSHAIVVTSLATTSSAYSASVGNASDALSGSLILQAGSGASQTIIIDSGNNTLSTLSAAINGGSFGVTANVVADSTGSRLSLVSNQSGAAGQLTVTANLQDSVTASSVGFTVQDGADAQLSVDGLPISSASNTVTGAIPGVTFQLLSASTAPVQAQISNDNSAVETAVQSMVTAYNTTVAALKMQEGKDSTGAAEPLYGSPTLALLQQQLSAGLLSGGSSGSIGNIAQLGLSLGQDGTLTLNASTLTSVLNSSFSDVTGYFQNTGSFGQTLSTSLNLLGASSPTGAITLALAQNGTDETGLNTNLSNEDSQMAAEKIKLTTELTTANQILQSIPQQLNAVNEIYSATTGYNTTHN